MDLLQIIRKRLKLARHLVRYGHLGHYQAEPLAQITPEDLSEIKTFFPMEKFFIFGYARSGTTLLARLVRTHPDVHCNYQAHFFSRKPLLSDMAADPQIPAWMAKRSNRWNRGNDMTTVALRAMADYIMERDARKEGARIVGDKSPNVVMEGRAVFEMHTFYPDARLVFIVRDGRDALISNRFQNFIDGERHLNASDFALRDAFEANPEPFLKGERSIFTERRLRLMAKSWVTNVTETHQNGQELFGDQYHVLKYEDLLNQPFQTISGVWKFLGADPSGMEEVVHQEMEYNPDAEYQKEVASELVKPLEKGKRGSWRELFTQRDKQIFKEVAGQTLIDWGYEPDMEW